MLLQQPERIADRRRRDFDLARAGNISLASRKLEIPPPSVSNALRLLDEHIVHSIF
ncbi:hypothetical protein QMN72_30530, partial [Klebsiella pneumoniae]|nr:hypothetical protein [Klebsiella pneumoniae]